MEAVDWIMRCQACCVSTGLSADLLLQATALKTQSPASDWKTVGAALIAATIDQRLQHSKGEQAVAIKNAR